MYAFVSTHKKINPIINTSRITRITCSSFLPRHVFHSSKPTPHTHPSTLHKIIGVAYCSSTNHQNPQPSFTIHRISGDGRCLFRSLAQGHHIASSIDTSTTPYLLNYTDETTAADTLRNSLCNHLLKHRDQYEPFIDSIDYESYIKHMRQPSTWGGEPEISAAANHLQRNIHVYSISNNSGSSSSLNQISEYCPTSIQNTSESDNDDDAVDNKKAGIYLLFHGLGHYDVLLPSTKIIQSKL